MSLDGPMRIYIRLAKTTGDALIRAASQNRRHPSDRAAIYVKNSLLQEGMLSSSKGRDGITDLSDENDGISPGAN